jgi:predicted MarR family transcription regulator
MKSKGQAKAQPKQQAKAPAKASKSTKPQIHIGRGAVELALFEFQHAAICYIEAFYRHVERQIILVTGDPNLSAQDCIILHAIRLGERPKSMTEIQHFSNRRDIANIQYSIRKLIKADLVQKAKRDAGRGTFYELTKYGYEITEAYVSARTDMLNEYLSEQPGFVRDAETATRTMMMLTGIYDHLSRTDTMRMVAAE